MLVKKMLKKAAKKRTAKKQLYGVRVTSIAKGETTGATQWQMKTKKWGNDSKVVLPTYNSKASAARAAKRMNSTTSTKGKKFDISYSAGAITSKTDIARAGMYKKPPKKPAKRKTAAVYRGYGS